MTIEEIRDELKILGGHYSIMVPEFTYNGIRIDAIVINIRHRWIRGFEIKINRADWVKDTKWVMYSEFCSSLSIVCPQELIQPEEIKKPFGLLWLGPDVGRKWMRRPQNFQKRNSLAWLWTYIRVLEMEFPRIEGELNEIKSDLRWTQKRLEEIQNKP